MNEERMALIIEAIKTLKPEDFTKSGSPNLAALKHTSQGFKLLGAWCGVTEYISHNTSDLFGKIDEQYQSISSFIDYSNTTYPLTSFKPTTERLLKLIRVLQKQLI